MDFDGKPPKVIAMKSQGILFLLKLISMEKSGASEVDYSVWQLNVFTGISKSELSAALNRCIHVGLAAGKIKGQAIAPLFKSVPVAAKADPKLYELLALVDAVRIGSLRKTQLAAQLLEKEFVYESI